MGGGEEVARGGGEATMSRGCPHGREGVQGVGMEDRRVPGGILTASTEGGKMEGGGCGRLGAMPWLSVKENRLCLRVSEKSLLLLLLLFLLTVFLGKDDRSVSPVPLPNGSAQWWGGGDTVKVSRKKTEDVEEGSSGGKKQKRREDEEAAKVEFSLMVEELWGRVARRWEELEWWQEERWAAVTATLGCIADDVWELLDGLVLEEKEKGKEKGVEMDVEEMEMEETGEAEGAEESGEMGAGTEKDRDGEMEVEEMLKEAEKSADEVVMEE